MQLGPIRKQTRGFTLGALLVALPSLSACFWNEHTAEPTLTVTSIVMNPAAATMRVGETTYLIATPITFSGEQVFGKTYVWTSADPLIAESRAGGVVIGKKVGSVAVTVTVDGIKGLTQVTVTP